MGIILEKGQQDAVDKVTAWFRKRSKQTFVLSGLAGTGKTTIVKYFIDKLNIHPNDMAFVAYTGKAALVLTNMGTPATTIHRLIYKPEEQKDGSVKFLKVQKLPASLRLIVVDESSMVSAETQRDLESFNVPIIYLGDHGQLPPVEGFSKLFLDPDVKLEKIHRQAEGNPIIWMAKLARLGAKLPYKEFGPTAKKISLKQVTPQLLLSVDQILCGKNVTRHKLNARVRQCLGFTTPKVCVNDRVIFLRNNWQEGFINGMTGVVKELGDFDRRMLKEKDYWRVPQEQQAMTFVSDCSDDVFSNVAFDAGVFAQQIAPDMKNTCIEPMDYAYALTVHKAQGSQYNTVMVVEEYLGSPEVHKKWLYTAITRAVGGIIVVGK